VSCASGGTCTPTTQCKTGAYDCSTGQQLCNITGNATDGTTCTGGTCCGGSCITSNNNSACGPSCKVCANGSQCNSGQCVLTVGNGPGSIATCASFNGFQSGYIFTYAVSVPVAIKATTLGIVGGPGSGGVNVILALYSAANTGNMPGSKVAATGSLAFGPGKVEGSIGSINLPAGTYWLGVEFSGQGIPCCDTSTSNQVYFGSANFGVVPLIFSNDTAAGSPAGTVNFEMYLVGTE
jgi:hypothetical protein